MEQETKMTKTPVTTVPHHTCTVQQQKKRDPAYFHTINNKADDNEIARLGKLVHFEHTDIRGHKKVAT